MKKIIEYLKRETVLCVATFLALVSMFFVKPDRGYADYLDARVLALLFCLMTVMEGFKKTGLFEQMANDLLKKVKTFRQLMIVLVGLCFFSSMWITNDVALLTFVPFTILVLRMAQMEQQMIAVVTMETIAANLGITLLACVLLYATGKEEFLPGKVDYGLLLTFVAFFIFIGNMGRIDWVKKVLEKVLAGNELFLGFAGSQVISNVPAAILLSGFTKNYAALLQGVNIGGLGTMIASLASLISYKFYAEESEKNKNVGTKGKYFWYFTGWNLVFAAVLLTAAVIGMK